LTDENLMLWFRPLIEHVPGFIYSRVKLDDVKKMKKNLESLTLNNLDLASARAILADRDVSKSLISSVIIDTASSNGSAIYAPLPMIVAATGMLEAYSNEGNEGNDDLFKKAMPLLFPNNWFFTSKPQNLNLKLICDHLKSLPAGIQHEAMGNHRRYDVSCPVWTYFEE
jgi:hypothetical protein